MDMRFDGVNYFAADARLHYGSVSIKDGYIDRVDMADAAPHGGAKLLLPGCIDTHTHAMLQSEYFAEDEAASAAARRALAQSGTTAFLFATMAMDEASLALRCRAAARAVKQKPAGESRCLGVYLEGPFLSYEKRGAHNPKFLHLPDGEMLRRLDDAAEGCIRAVCMAPELDGAIDLAKKLKGKKVVSFAHSAAGTTLPCRRSRRAFPTLRTPSTACSPCCTARPGPLPRQRIPMTLRRS